jgi:hypothetical protein
VSATSGSGILSQKGGCPNRDSKQLPHEYNSEALPVERTCLVKEIKDEERTWT